METTARLTSFTASELEAIGNEFEDQPPQVVLRWAFHQFHPEIALACSFGAEDVVLVDMIVEIEPAARIFYLDTDFLFPETRDVIERVKMRYGIEPVAYRSLLTPEEQARLYGENLYWRDPDRCCALRKVEPLQRALAGLRAWITGIRREQAPTRAHARLIEWDRKFGLVKINPLVRWTAREVWSYIKEHHVPYNVLHDHGYPSIGCWPCTQPVAPGEDPRSGRWRGFQKTECGLHA
ncbi:MAG TPA: phosphoadenylyl-sulfate reductase [Blastocatellia bacterium]|nr:phosphoadenylyl-sulfate reductase [Blastocatellia bacterium]